MSGLYDIKELGVINEEMLEKAIEEQEPQGQAGFLKESLNYNKVTELRLDYASKILTYRRFCCMCYFCLSGDYLCLFRYLKD